MHWMDFGSGSDFELWSDIYINIALPEETAAFVRDMEV